MRVALIKSDRIRTINIPDNPSGNFWITDYDENGKEVNIVNIKEDSGKWNLLSNNEFLCVLNNSYVDHLELNYYSFYHLKKVATQEIMTIYVSSSYDEDMKSYYLNPVEGSVITIGNNGCNINYANLDANHAQIIFENGKYNIYPISESNGVYVNNMRVLERKNLEYGDIIFIAGLKFVFTRENNFYKLCFYVHNVSMFGVQGLPKGNDRVSEEPFSEVEEEIDVKWYSEDDYFHKTPRFISDVSEKEITVDMPPTKESEQQMPVMLTIGPMLTMSMSSMVMAFVSINNMKSGSGSLISTLPSITMAVAMILSTLLWPSITRKYENKIRKIKEKERIDKYSKYIDSRRQLILNELQSQTHLLKSLYPSMYDCFKIITEKRPELWQKRIEDDDFLKISLGYGDYPMKLKISYPEEHFSMVEDELIKMADKLSREPKILKDVPIEYSFLENNISSIVGTYGNRIEYFKKLLLQIITFHSYVDLKLVVLTDNDKKSNWKYIKNLPYCFSDDKKIRYFASTKEEYTDLANYLEKIFSSRKENYKNSDKHTYDKIYLIVTDSLRMIRRNDFIDNLLKEKNNFGFSFIILNKNIASLPDQCKSFINVDLVNGSVAKNIINSKPISFIQDLMLGINYNECYKILSNIPIETNDTASTKIPDKLGFLQMYDVGKVEQLNSLNRWQKSNPMQTLKTPVGMGKNDEIQYIDLHEKYHGPHGLIAGMTGSGKSEFIISYILSLAVNYHPYEVQFILIDYKGGGLAGAFENANSGKKLPHLVGVITNLDKSEIKRTLSSIESELKRRQRLFNIARDKTDESTVDIYKYQRLYRDGKVEEPVSHLFIISDEFAELKTQEPEFMEQLISTARIGRSLGVHLILATQKPSGVVDPQIWSNTRFRVCLRVQDKSDSNEVIKCPDAAFLTSVGRFYFQVGYNEVFTLGQAAWAGGKYIPEEKTVKEIDTSIEFIDNVGRVVKKVETKDLNTIKPKEAKGEELSNIINYLYDIADSEKIKCKPLWLEKIASFIKIDNLIKKYDFKTIENSLNIPVGEFDIPSEQKQGLLTVDFTKSGNTIIYGAAGSGKENFIQTLIYSSMLLYTPSDVNFYIMDFGAEILKEYINSNYVGDVVGLDDEDKIKNLYKLLSNTLEQRKDLFSMYGGNYNDYVTKSGKKIPNIVIVLNNYEAYQDSYEEYTDLLNTITRDCTKYGIYFIFTCNTPNGLRFKLKQNFSNIYCLAQNNEDDYSAILGNVNKQYPSKIFGRGIIKRDMVYEFQTASVDVKEDVSQTIDKLIDDRNSKYDYKIRKIPVLPKEVKYDDVKDYLDNDNIIIGIEKNSLQPFKYNLARNFITAISTNDTSNLTDFINAFINQLKIKEKTNTMVIAASDYGIKDNTKSGIVYENSDMNKIFDSISTFVDGCYKILEQSNFNSVALSNQNRLNIIINGLDTFKTKLSEENKGKINDVFKKAKDIGIINLIIVDSINNLKKYEFDPWFKEGFNASEGIWIGNGIKDQFTFKPTIRTPEIRESITDDFCFVLLKGKPYLVKYVSDFSNSSDEEFIEL